MRRPALWLPLATMAVLAFVLPGVRLDVDVFNLLPADSEVVRGLAEYQHSFGSSHELIVSLRSDDPTKTVEAARTLAAALGESGLASRVVWNNPVGEDPEAWSDLLAYLWLNQPPDRFRAMAARFDADRLDATLERTLERMGTSFDPAEVARLSVDPYALTDLPEEIESILDDRGRDPFASADGTFRVMFVRPPFEDAGFWEQRAWVADVRTRIAQWREGDAVVTRITGDPVFVAEVGSGLLDDMRRAAVGTLLIVALLFWLAHRRLAPLVWLVTLLVLVLMATIAIGGALLGALNAVSLGFAAILLGLAADYGLILYQERIAEPGLAVGRLRAAVAPSILWAAVTTAGAFLMIGRSSLPGLTQLGTLVAIGVLVAAVVMLLCFLPPLAEVPRVTGRDRTRDAWWSRPAGARLVWSLTAVALLLSAGVLVVVRPGLDASTDDLGPKDSPAKTAIDEIQRELGGEHDALWLIVSGSDESEVARRLGTVSPVLDDAVERGVLSGFILPEPLWPRPPWQRENLPAARQLGRRIDPVIDAALAAGFVDGSLDITQGVFARWSRLDGVERAVWPTHPGSRWVFRQFAAEHGGRWLALGRLDAADDTRHEDLLALADGLAEGGGVRMFGWTLLSRSLLGNMRRDVERVLLPMGVVLVLILAVAFRNPLDVLLAFAVLGFTLLCLLACMALFGWSWNLMNVMALPLLFGAGVDYSIHVQLALRRHAGDLGRVRRTVGRAILLCGLSTASGFGTLAWASNAGLASLGRVCAAGILIACLTSVTLLPVWWRAARRLGSETG